VLVVGEKPGASKAKICREMGSENHIAGAVGVLMSDEPELTTSDLSTLFRTWLRTSEIGDILVYFSGNLAAARQQHQKIAEGANTVWREGRFGSPHTAQTK